MNNDPESEKRWPENLTPLELGIVLQEREVRRAISNGTFEEDCVCDPPGPTKPRRFSLPPDLIGLVPELTEEEKEEFAQRAARRRAKQVALEQWLSEGNGKSNPVR